MEGCQRRESEKLELMEKLATKNAELQSENSALNDKVMALSVEVQSQKMGLQSKESNLDELNSRLSKCNICTQIKTNMVETKDQNARMELNRTREQHLLKQRFVFGFLSLLVELKVLKKIKVSFLMVGHTHEDIDQVFSRFSVWLNMQLLHYQD
ncbi:uncharacterized protein LOC143072525 [Mytilus galloprovincialis]|uniref:uncharacterized protein LOC143072525 n=1 Tax=Mytilus galloprovincialis TaxID=29158 RepID=UPI003F7B9DC5